jgi:hypothetical protein
METVTPENIDDFVDKAINACYDRANRALVDIANRPREVPKPEPKPEPKPKPKPKPKESEEDPERIHDKDFRILAKKYGFDIRTEGPDDDDALYAYDAIHPTANDWFLNVAMLKSSGVAIVGRKYTTESRNKGMVFNIIGTTECTTVKELEEAICTIAKSRDEFFKPKSTKRSQNRSRTW